AVEPGKERSEAVGSCREEERRAGLVSAGLEPHLHQRARLLRERHEEVRPTGCGSAWRERGQRMVAQSLRGKNGHQVFAAGGFSSARRHERKVWRLPG